MQADVFENWNKLTQQTLENWKKLGEANLKIGEKLLQEQIDLTTTLVEVTAEGAEEISQTKDAKEVAALQAELVQECSKKIVESCRSCADLMAEAGKVYNTLFDSALKAAGGEFAAKKGKKAA